MSPSSATPMHKGVGDEFHKVYPFLYRRHNVAFFLEEQLRRDIVNFGVSGRSSIGAYVRDPISSLKLARGGFPVEDPKEVVAFFYEGNDLSDNLKELQLAGLYHYGKSLTRKEFSHFVPSREVTPTENYMSDFMGLKWIEAMTIAYYNLGSLKAWGYKVEKKFSSSPEYNLADVGGKLQNLPKAMQSGSLHLSVEDVDTALRTFDLSLQTLRDEIFPKAKISVVYVPAPINCYSVTGRLSVDLSDPRLADPINTSDAQLVEERSRIVSNRVKRIVDDLGIRFIDPRPVLVKATRGGELVHGPLDWDHFNRRGYEILAQTITQELRTHEAPKAKGQEG